MILLKWKLSLISMHLDCLLNFTKASWMMIRKNLPKNIWKCRRQELCHCYTISVAWQPGICFNSVYVLISRGLFTRNTNAFPDFNLSSHHWKFIFYIVTRTAPFASYLDSEWKCKIGIDTTDISLEAHSSAKGPFSTYFWLEKLSNAGSDLPKSKNERSQL